MSMMANYLFILSLLLTATILTSINLYLHRYLDIPAVRPFIGLLWLAVAWDLIYSATLGLESVPSKILLIQLDAIPQAIIPVMVLITVLDYTSQNKFLTPKNLIYLSILPTLFILLSLSSNYHSLMLYNLRINDTGPIPILLFDRGPFFIGELIYNDILVLFSLVLLTQSMSLRNHHFWNTIILIFSIGLPLVCSILFNFGYSPIEGLNFTPFTFVFSGVLFVWGILKFNLFNIIPVKYSSIIESLDDPIIVLDMHGHFAEFNQAASRICGLRPGISIGKSPSILSSYWMQAFNRFQNKQLTKEEITIDDGVNQSIYDLTVSPLQDGRGQTNGQVFLFHDITANKRIEEDLRSSQHLLQTVLENFPGFVFWKDVKSRYLGCNKAFAISTGNPNPETLIGKTDYELGYSPKAADEYRSEDLRVIQEGSSVLGKTKLHIRANSKSVWLNTNKVPLKDINGNIFGILGISQDISQIKQAEEEILLLNSTLEHRVKERTQQLEIANNELSSTSYSIAHDFRTPLRAMDGYSHILLEEYSDKLDSEGKKYLERIRYASHRLGRLTDDLLKLLSITRSEINIKKVDLSRMGQEIINKLSENQPERKVDFNFTKGIIVNADPFLIRILMTSLLNNAWKFTKNQNPGQITLGCQEQDGNKIVFIRDNGVGFDMAYAEKLFGVFQRLHTNPEFEGTGIGLALAQRVIHRHGGDIWAEGVLGQGATFYFKL